MAVQSNVEVYKALMQGASVRADTIKSQFDAYEARAKGEAAKAGVLESQSRAYAATVQAVTNKAEIKVKGAQIKMGAARTKVSKFLADVNAFKARIDASLREVQYGTQVYQVQVEGWRAKSNAVVADAEMQSRFTDMNTRTNIAYAQMISEYTARMQNAVQQAQIAAGAMSAMHVSAGISGSGSASASDSNSNSISTTYNYQY
ncbi:hypothetical protein FHT32_002885 [Variovorax sp. SG517]|uniref:hypothetical protein n=1 Tax=Variovorax sp. SG517 TaxID=2587117 RepID=UPI0018276CC5|nr:hypothetical protein [Variovorax sp. SG517]NVM89230.1 hypothetical protein [Variovorax sp. SG517]